jgi:hypothetical protein
MGVIDDKMGTISRYFTKRYSELFFMKNSLLILILVLVNSCALLDKYESSQFTAYDNSLTENEKSRIKLNGQIVKGWFGENDLGDYEKGNLFISSRNQKLYKFIQIGDWETLHKLSKGNRNLGTLKQISTFDSLGNLLTRDSYIKPKNEGKFYLVEKVRSKISGDKKFIQSLERINSEGWLMYSINYEYINYLTPDNDRLKIKEIKDMKYYDKAGNEVPEYYDKEIDGLVKRVRMKK